MYQRLCSRLPHAAVDIGYVVWRAALMVAVAVYSDATLGAFQYMHL